MTSAYDKENKHWTDVCEDCIEENPCRFADEEPPKLENTNEIVEKLRKKEPLTDEEVKDLIEWLKKNAD